MHTQLGQILYVFEADLTKQNKMKAEALKSTLHHIVTNLWSLGSLAQTNIALFIYFYPNVICIELAKHEPKLKAPRVPMPSYNKTSPAEPLQTKLYLNILNISRIFWDFYYVWETLQIMPNLSKYPMWMGQTPLDLLPPLSQPLFDYFFDFSSIFCFSPKMSAQPTLDDLMAQMALLQAQIAAHTTASANTASVGSGPNDAQPLKAPSHPGVGNSEGML